MSAGEQPMHVTIEDRGMSLREKLRERLDRAASLRCAEHDAPVAAVRIHGRENGWFDTQWTTCCERLERAAADIVKQRC
jgi:hypothetical protein